MRRKIPSLQALACFDAAARHQSYTRAAQELALTQSAISRQISALESYLGVELFRRTRHGVVLSEPGAHYARQIAPRLQALERDTLDAMTGQGAGGAVHLAVVPTFGARWLIPRLAGFSALQPDVQVHLDSRTRPFMFADTEFDAALMAGTAAQMAQWAGTRATAVLPEVAIAVCSPALLPTLDATWTTMPFLQQSTRPNAWREWLDAAGLPGSATALAGPRFEQFSMTAAAAVAGLGVALIPRLLIEAELSRGDLVQAHAFALSGQRQYYLVQPETPSPKPALQAFTQWLVESCAISSYVAVSGAAVSGAAARGTVETASTITAV